MGIDYDGGMIVGRHYNDCEFQDWNEDDQDIWEYCEDKGLDSMNQWYDSGPDGMIVGICMEDTDEESFEKWTESVKETFKKVEKLIGVKPHLIGTQNIW